MRNTTLLALIAAATVTTAGCSSSPSAATNNRATPAATRSQIAFPSPIPTAAPIPCAAGSEHCLALVGLKGGYEFAVRDITDIGHPRTVSTPSDVWVVVRFVSATELSYISGCILYRVPLSGSPQTMTVHGRLCVMAFAWSPDGNSLAYLVDTEVHILREGNDQVIGTLPQPYRYPTCPTRTCADSNDSQLTWSPDGGVVMWEQNPTSTFRVWTADGVDVTPSVGTPSMAVWSGPGLFFEDSKGVEVFRNGSVSQFLPGVIWIRPKASPIGGQIVYESRDAAGLAHSYMVDTSSGKVRELGVGRAEPAFLTSRFIWYQGERLCTATENCAGDTPVKPTYKTYVYDLQDGTETQSIITSVYDIWPHAA